MNKITIRDIFHLKQIRLPANKLLKASMLLKICIANILIVYVIFMIYIYLTSLLYSFLSTSSFSFSSRFALYSVRWAMFDQFFSGNMYLGGEFFIPYQLAYLIYIISTFICCWQPDIFCQKKLSPVLLAIGLSVALSFGLSFVGLLKVVASHIIATGAIGFLLCPFYFILLGYDFFVVFGKYLLANRKRDYYNQPGIVNSILGVNVAGFIFVTILYINMYAEVYFKKQRLFFF